MRAFKKIFIFLSVLIFFLAAEKTVYPQEKKRPEKKKPNCEAQLISLMRDNLNLVKKVKQLERAVGQPEKGGLKQRQPANPKGLEAKNASLSKELETKTQELGQLKKQVLQLKAKAEELQEVAKKNNELVFSLKYKESELREYKAKLSSLGKEGPASSAKIQQGLQVRIEKLQQENNSLSQALQAKAQELTALKKQPIPVKAKPEELTSALKDKDRQLQEYKARLAQQQGPKDTLDKLEKDKDALTKMIKDKSKENEKLNLELANLKGIVYRLNKGKAILEAMLNNQPKDLRSPEKLRADTKMVDRDIHVNLGYAYAKKGNIEEAIAEYRAALKYNPKDKDIHYNLGYLLAKKGSYQKATEEYKQALGGSQQDREIYYNLAIIYAVNLNEPRLAQDCYAKFSEFSPSEDRGLAPYKK